MKALVLLIAILFAPLAFSGTPYPPEIDNRLNLLETNTVNTNLTKKVARVAFDVSGSSTILGSSTVGSGYHGLGVYLPANTILTDSYVYISTAFTNEGTGPGGVAGSAPTLGVECEDSNNIFNPKDITTQSAGYVFSGEQSGASAVPGASAMVRGNIAAMCEIKARVQTSDFAAGKAIIFVEYFVAE